MSMTALADTVARLLPRWLADRRPLLGEALRFSLVGASGFVVDVGVFLGLQAACGTSHQLARELSFWAAASWNWFWNRRLTFAHRRQPRKRVQWPAFVLSSLVGFALNYGVYLLLTAAIPACDHDLGRIAAMFVGVVAGMGANFALARSYVFRVRGQEPAAAGPVAEGVPEV